MYLVMLVFFFKQKTAYEMRISDWSSDVCSSDLHRRAVDRQRLTETRQRGAVGAQQEDRFHEIALGLLDGERGEVTVVERALGHHPVDGELQDRKSVV